LIRKLGRLPGKDRGVPLGIIGKREQFPVFPTGALVGRDGKVAIFEAILTGALVGRDGKVAIFEAILFDGVPDFTIGVCAKDDQFALVSDTVNMGERF
jgi:hypothetical protein